MSDALAIYFADVTLARACMAPAQRFEIENEVYWVYDDRMPRIGAGLHKTP